MSDVIKKGFADYFILMPRNPTNKMIINALEVMITNFVEVENIEDIDYSILYQMIYESSVETYINELNEKK